MVRQEQAVSRRSRPLFFFPVYCSLSFVTHHYAALRLLFVLEVHMLKLESSRVSPSGPERCRLKNFSPSSSLHTTLRPPVLRTVPKKR